MFEYLLIILFKLGLKMIQFGFQCIPENYPTEIPQVPPERHEVMITMREVFRQRRKMGKRSGLAKPLEITVSAVCIQVFWHMEP